MKPEFSLEKTAKLARLTLGADESERLYKELCAMIEFAGRLPDMTETGEENGEGVLREDIVSEGLARTELLKNAPDQTDGYFRVPRTVKED